MQPIIQEIAKTISAKFVTELELLMTENRDISEFIVAIKATLDEVGAKLVAEALETIDQAIKESQARKRNWVVQSKAEEKNLVTVFGEVSYKRTYYKNKTTGEYSYLSDEAVGIFTHDKMDTLLKARLIEEAIEVSYRRSGAKASEAVQLTSQTVMNCIRELGNIDNDASGIEAGKKAVKTLYIEADEDHVALQDGRHVEPKLVYVHEGRKKAGKDRWELINPRYFSGIYDESDDLWLEIADYIDKAYESNAIEKVYISGDGAAWIKNGLGWIKDSVYVLDRYHLSKYVIQATAHIEGSAPIMWEYINSGEKKKLQELFTAIIKSTEGKSKKRAVQEAKRYILGNWEGIRNQYQEDYGGCSAEGHVSHILSSRLSSRPSGWCRTGVDQMSRLRAFAANGGKVYDLLMTKKKQALNQARAFKLDQRIINRRTVTETHETLGNLTILNIGKKTSMMQFLRSIRTA